MRACNGVGTWDRAGIVYRITQRPYYYETSLFRLAVAGVILLCLVSAYKLRLRRIAAVINARFDERMAERDRLASELHDTILQTVQATKMIADNARLDHSADPVRLRKDIESISDWLTQATAEARAALNALRTSTAQKNDLEKAFQRAAEAAGVPSSMRFILSVEGAAQEMRPIVRDEVYRIGSSFIGMRDL